MAISHFCFHFFVLFLFFFCNTARVLGKEESVYISPHPLKEAKPEIPTVTPQAPSNCSPHCCDVEMHVVKKQGEAEAALGKAAQEVVARETVLQHSQEEVSTTHLGFEAQNAENAMKMAVKKAIVDNDLAENKVRDEEMELAKLKEVDGRLEAEVAAMEAAVVAAEKKELNHEKHELNELTREERKLDQKISEETLEKSFLNEKIEKEEEKKTKREDLNEKLQSMKEEPSEQNRQEIENIAREVAELEEEEKSVDEKYKHQRDEEKQEKIRQNINKDHDHAEQIIESAKNIHKHLSLSGHANVANEVGKAEMEIHDAEQLHQKAQEKAKEEEQESRNVEETKEEFGEESENESAQAFFSSLARAKGNNGDDMVVFPLYPQRRTYRRRLLNPSDKKIGIYR